jgi:hypothetical protein
MGLIGDDKKGEMDKESKSDDAFVLSNIDNVIIFEKCLLNYNKQRSSNGYIHISLKRSFEVFYGSDNGPKIFTAIFDLVLNSSFLLCDISNAAGIHNSYFTKGKLEGGSILDSDVKFVGKLDIHRSLSSFIFRYRAIWDKILGLLILLFEPESYNDFVGAKSRKKYSLNLLKDKHHINEKTFKKITTLINWFDEAFRTPEAHITGRLRKRSLLMGQMTNDPQDDLNGAWDDLNELLHMIGDAIKDSNNDTGINIENALNQWGEKSSFVDDLIFMVKKEQ